MLDGYKPKAGDEQKFKDKHVVVKSKLSKPTENEAQFTAPAVKVYKRGPTHGYDQGKDEEVYEAADQTPPFAPSKSTFKKAKNPNRTPMDSVKALAQKGMKTKTNEEVEGLEEMDKSQTPPGRDGGEQFAPGPKVSKKTIKAVQKDPAKHLSDLFTKQYAKKKMKEEAELDEAVNEKQIKKDIDSGMSHDAVIGKHANKKLSNTDEIRKVIQRHAWDKRMKKEEVEQIDEKLKASDPTSTWIHDFVHSKNKKFAGKSKEQRINMALGAKYAKEDYDFSDEELVLLEAAEGAKSLYMQHHKDSMDMLKKISSALKQHKDNASMGSIHYGHAGDMKMYKRGLEDMHDQISQQAHYAKPLTPMREEVEEEQAPLFERTGSLSKIVEAAYKKQPVGVKIHYTHPEKKATWAQHFSAQDAASGEKEMAAQGYKVKKRELIYGKAGA